HPRVLTRFAETADIIGGAARVEATGASRTERLLGLVHFGDLVSLYLAVLAGNDPVEIPALLELKRRLSG
ncbi:MAG: Bacterial phospho-glucose isomerase C-terminal domain, partial [Solirubrobacteraceae bacterium]|nr:Bacterial phospho-glucose isomerase C-terminal domain [Solirubrobacteraceae bacterium]